MASPHRDMEDDSLVDTTMGLATSPACLGYSESHYGSPVGLEPRSPESVVSPGKGHKKRPMYNRNTVKMEEYIHKRPENITAKEYRVLIPTMFQTWRHPSKASSRTKVKGLWEKGEKPIDWPSSVTFRDPNNHPKFSLDDSKIVFKYLQEKILNSDKYRHLLTVKEEPKSVFPGPLQSPGHPPFGENPGHDLSSSMVGVPSDSAGIQEQTPDQNAASLPLHMTHQPVNLNEFYAGDSELAMKSGVRLVKDEPAPSPQGPCSTMMQCDVSEEQQNTQQLTVYETVREENGQIITDLAVMHPFTDSTATSQVITVLGEESSVQAVNPQPTEALVTVSTPLSSAEQKECKQFAEDIQKGLFPVVKSFCQTFEQNKVIMDKVSKVVDDTFKPLYDSACSCKASCGELSKLGGRLQEMMKRHTFLSASTQADVILQELDQLQADFNTQQCFVITEDVPQVQKEVLIMTAQESTQPNLQPVGDVYIPTIADLEARAKLKQMELESEPMDTEETKEELYVKEKLDQHPEWMIAKDHQDCGSTPEETLDPASYGVTLKEGQESESVQIQQINLETLMDDIHFLNSAGSAIFENLGIESRPVTEESSQPQQIQDDQTQAQLRWNYQQTPFAPVESPMSTESQPSGQTLIPQQVHLPTQPEAPPQMPPQMPMNQQMPPKILVNQHMPPQMPEQAQNIAPTLLSDNHLSQHTQVEQQNSVGRREEQAMNAFLSSAQRHFGGTMILEELPSTSVNEFPLEDILSLEAEFPLDDFLPRAPSNPPQAMGTMASFKTPEQPVIQKQVPVREVHLQQSVAIPGTTISTTAVPGTITHTTTPSGTIPNELLTRLQTSNLNKAPIPSVVFEAANRPDTWTTKKSRPGKGSKV